MFCYLRYLPEDASSKLSKLNFNMCFMIALMKYSAAFIAELANILVIC